MTSAATAGRVGLEIELLAPRGRSRHDVAECLAAALDGTVVAVWHLDSEPSAHPDVAVFHHLTPAFDVVDRDGRRIASVVDDVTLTDDLQRGAPSRPGWHRIVSDDRRLLRIVEATLGSRPVTNDAIESVAKVLGLHVTTEVPGVQALVTRDRATVALVSGVPDERERPSEIVSGILEPHEVAPWLAAVVAVAADLGLTIPAEAATHVHLDAAPLRDAAALQRFVRHVAPRMPDLRAQVATNPRCRRLGPWPDELVATVSDVGFAQLAWPDAAAAVVRAGATKWCDVNLLNLVKDTPDKPTVELRLFPVVLDVTTVLGWIELSQELVASATSSDRVVS